MLFVAPEQTTATNKTVDTTAAPAEAAAAAITTAPPANNVDILADTQTAADGEDRQEATYFASWGAPEARSGPSKSCPAIASLCACANLEQRLKFAGFSSRACLLVQITPSLRLLSTEALSSHTVSSKSAMLRS